MNYTLRTWIFIIVGLALGIGGFYWLLTNLEAFSKFGEAFLYVVIFTGSFAALDAFVLKGIDTIDQLKEGNIAYAIFMLAVALVILAAAVIVS